MKTRLLSTALFVAATFACARAAHAQQNFDTVKVTSVRVAEGIYMLLGSGGNIGLVTGPDATYLIDDQYAPLTPKILAAVKAVTSQPVKFLLNTHYHGDHTGGNENLGNAGVVIFAHDNVRARMSTAQFIERLKQTVPASPKASLPVVTFSDTMTLHFNGETVAAYHVPGAHTDGDAVVHFKNANVVHTGDVYVRYGFPFIDASSGGSFAGMVAAAERLLATTNANTKFIPGHGALADRKDVEEYLKMMKTVRDRVRAQVQARKTLAQVIAAKPLADLDKAYGQGFIKTDAFLEMVYAEMTRK